MHVKFENDFSNPSTKIKTLVKTFMCWWIPDSWERGRLTRLQRKREGKCNMVLGRNFLRQLVKDLWKLIFNEIVYCDVMPSLAPHLSCPPCPQTCSTTLLYTRACLQESVLLCGTEEKWAVACLCWCGADRRGQPQEARLRGGDQELGGSRN